MFKELFASQQGRKLRFFDFVILEAAEAVQGLLYVLKIADSV